MPASNQKTDLENLMPTSNQKADLENPMPASDQKTANRSTLLKEKEGPSETKL